jgi:hypothetical protein
MAASSRAIVSLHCTSGGEDAQIVSAATRKVITIDPARASISELRAAVVMDIIHHSDHVPGGQAA